MAATATKVGKATKAAKAPTMKQATAAATKGKKKKESTGFAHTAPIQIRAMVEWLEVDANYNVLIGNSNAGGKMQHGGGVRKIKGYGDMADYVHAVTLDEARKGVKIDPRLLNKWDPVTCRSRWRSHFQKYTKLKNERMFQTGFGLTAQESAQGMTLEAALEKRCYLFGRIQQRFGHQANIQPISAVHAPVDTERSTTNEPTHHPTNETRVENAEEEIGGDGMDLPASNSTVIVSDNDDDGAALDGHSDDEIQLDEDDDFSFTLAQIEGVDSDCEQSVDVTGDSEQEREDEPRESASAKAHQLLARAHEVLNTQAVAQQRSNSARVQAARSNTPQARRKATDAAATSQPALASCVNPTVDKRTAEEKGVAKAQADERKDFGSLFERGLCHSQQRIKRLVTQIEDLELLLR